MNFEGLVREMSLVKALREWARLPMSYYWWIIAGPENGSSITLAGLTTALASIQVSGTLFLVLAKLNKDVILSEKSSEYSNDRSECLDYFFRLIQCGKQKF